ncbi:MAG: hypothetical protein V5B36_00825 [Candidatus Accumulibacter sp. UW25]|jgi:hypothetical protein
MTNNKDSTVFMDEDQHTHLIIRYYNAPNVYDNRIFPEKQKEITWEQFVKKCSKRIISNEKKAVEMVVPVSFLTVNETDQYAKVTHKEAEFGRGTEGAVKTDEDDIPYVWKAGVNVKEWHMLPVDIDGQMSIEEAMHKFKEYEYVLYTSHSHRTEGKPFDCFRLFFPLETPVAHVSFLGRKKAMEKWLGNIDLTSISTFRAFYFPSCAQENKDKAFFHHNKGKLVNAFDFEPTVAPVPSQSSPSQSTQTDHSDNQDYRLFIYNLLCGLSTNLEFSTWRKIMWALKNWGFSKDEVKVVWRNVRSHRAGSDNFDQNWTFNSEIGVGALVNIIKSEFTDGESAIKQFWRDHYARQDAQEKYGNAPGPEYVLKGQEWIDEKGIVWDGKYVLCYPPDKRHELLLKGYNKWKLMAAYIHMLLNAFEGFGKSGVVRILRADDKKVVFACKTNSQAEEQAARFVREGFRVQSIVGREYTLERLGCTVIKDEPKHPWDNGQVNESKTKALIEEKGLDADEVWMNTEAPKANFHDYDVIVTTHARLLAWGKFKSIVPKEAIVVWDDMGRTDFEKYSNFDNRYSDKTIDGERIEQVRIGSKHYFVRPECLRYGYGLQNRMIFTTTEILTSHFIRRDFNVFEPKLMPDVKMRAGDIVLFKTKMTGAKKDGLLLPVFERLKKDGHKFYVIADGLGTQWNHTNSKGRNDLQDRDVVVEISQHPADNLPKVLDELGWTSSDQMKLKVEIALDQLHQAIGRNSGYRWADKTENDKKTVVVLCDYLLAQTIMERTRYFIPDSSFRDLDKPVTKRVNTTSLSGAVEWYMLNYGDYLTGAGKRGRNVNAYVSDCKAAMRNAQAKARMLTALNDLARSRIDSTYLNSVTAVLNNPIWQ